MMTLGNGTLFSTILKRFITVIDWIDCVYIPGALNVMTTTKQALLDRFCGRSVGLVTGSATASTVGLTVCSKSNTLKQFYSALNRIIYCLGDRTPFMINFYSDTYEAGMEALKLDTGFRLTYIQSSTNCN